MRRQGEKQAPSSRLWATDQGKERRCIITTELTVTDRACAILQATNDGDDLDPPHLKLLENAVNGFLNAKGEAAFEALYHDAMNGYKKPWFHGIENLTIANSGYVMWKGNRVEHYILSMAYSTDGRAQSLELARRCVILEARGETPTIHNAIWTWEEKEEVTEK